MPKADHQPLRSTRNVNGVLKDIATGRASGELTQSEFEMAINRMVDGQSRPQRLAISFSDLPKGGTRFFIKNGITGSVIDVIDCDSEM